MRRGRDVLGSGQGLQRGCQGASAAVPRAAKQQLGTATPPPAHVELAEVLVHAPHLAQLDARPETWGTGAPGEQGCRGAVLGSSRETTRTRHAMPASMHRAWATGGRAAPHQLCSLEDIHAALAAHRVSCHECSSSLLSSRSNSVSASAVAPASRYEGDAYQPIHAASQRARLACGMGSTRSSCMPCFKEGSACDQPPAAKSTGNPMPSSTAPANPPITCSPILRVLRTLGFITVPPIVT